MQPTKTPSDDRRDQQQQAGIGQISREPPSVIPVPAWLIVGAAIRADCRDSHADAGGPGEYAGVLAALERLADEGHPAARLVTAWIGRRRVGVAGPAASHPAVPSPVEAGSSSEGLADAVRSMPTREDEPLPPIDRSPTEGDDNDGCVVAQFAMTPARAIEAMGADSLPKRSSRSRVPHLRKPMPDMASGTKVDPAQDKPSPDCPMDKEDAR